MGVVKRIRTNVEGQIVPLVGHQFRFDDEKEVYLCVSRDNVDCIDCELAIDAAKCVKMLCHHNKTQFKLSVKSLL